MTSFTVRYWNETLNREVSEVFGTFKEASERCGEIVNWEQVSNLRIV